MGGGGGDLLRAVLGGEQPVLLREHQPLPLAGHLGRARVTCHVSRGTPALVPQKVPSEGL